jgi:cyclophilin family peptidyl-prolyl cis-trans isomerase
MHISNRNVIRLGSLCNSRSNNLRTSVIPSVSLSDIKQTSLAAICAVILSSSEPAHAVLNSPNAQIARTPESALRRAIPAFNSDVKGIQKSLEDIAYANRIPQRKPWGTMAQRVSEALESASMDRRERLLEGTPSPSVAEANDAADKLLKSLQKLELAVKTQQPDLTGLRVSESLQAVSTLELLQAPSLPYAIKKEYSSLPRLIGRASVEMRVEKKDSTLVFVDEKNGGLVRTGLVRLTLDGYSAPLTAGNFLANVLDKNYDGRPIQSSYTSLFVPGKLESPKPPVPLEILPLGEFEPIYRLPLDVQGGELPVLPLSISGALAMAHIPGSDSFVSGEEWFIYRYDKAASGLGGLAFDEGTFGVFGYITKGFDVLNNLQTGDVIVSMKVVEGQERLVRGSS